MSGRLKHIEDGVNRLFKRNAMNTEFIVSWEMSKFKWIMRFVSHKKCIYSEAIKLLLFCNCLLTLMPGYASIISIENVIAYLPPAIKSLGCRSHGNCSAGFIFFLLQLPISIGPVFIRDKTPCRPLLQRPPTSQMDHPKFQTVISSWRWFPSWWSYNYDLREITAASTGLQNEIKTQVALKDFVCRNDEPLIWTIWARFETSWYTLVRVYKESAVRSLKNHGVTKKGLIPQGTTFRLRHYYLPGLNLN